MNEAKTFEPSRGGPPMRALSVWLSVCLSGWQVGRLSGWLAGLVDPWWVRHAILPALLDFALHAPSFLSLRGQNPHFLARVCWGKEPEGEKGLRMYRISRSSSESQLKRRLQRHVCMLLLSVRNGEEDMKADSELPVWLGFPFAILYGQRAAEGEVDGYIRYVLLHCLTMMTGG